MIPSIGCVGAPLMRGIFENLGANAERQVNAIIAALPHDFPDQLVTSVRRAVKCRVRLLADTQYRAARRVKRLTPD